MRILLSVALLVPSCSILSPTSTSILDSRSGQVAGDVPLGCSVATVDVQSLGGSEVRVGRTITFSATPRDADGQALDPRCLDAAVQASLIGECVFADAAARPTLDGIEAYAAALGECKCRVTYGGKTGTSPAVEIVP